MRRDWPVEFFPLLVSPPRFQIGAEARYVTGSPGRGSSHPLFGRVFSVVTLGVFFSTGSPLFFSHVRLLLFASVAVW